MSLAAQKNSNINKRIAEQSKQIALETRRDSEAMKTIAILTVLFLPGTFVSVYFPELYPPSVVVPTLTVCSRS